MADEKKATTNTKSNSQEEIKYKASEFWSEAQEFAYKRLAVETKKNETSQIISDFNVRAKRISATYARFYLETEEFGDKKHKGRYYWMALGAFAAKQIACLLEDLRIRILSKDVRPLTPLLASPLFSLTIPVRYRSLNDTALKDSLGKGNMWLFYDVVPWHWAHNFESESMKKYGKERNAQKFVPELQKATKVMPWASDALSKIGNFKSNKYITEAFNLVRQIEKLDPIKKKGYREKIQFKHLMQIANHEQGIILQPLIYNDPDFKFWLELQRGWLFNWISPTLQLVFSSECETEKEELKSVAPEDTKLEDFQSRMYWIGKAAKKFHFLMQKKSKDMESELSKMSKWVNL